MGRRQKPPEEKEARGNPGRRPILKTSEAAAPALVEPPDWLEGEALEIFREEVPYLNALRFIRRSDREAFAHACVHAAQVRWACRDIAENGQTYWAETTTGGKMLRVNPAYTILSRSTREFANYADAFGMRPDARMRMMAQQAAQGQLPLTPEQGQRKPGAGTPQKDSEGGTDIKPTHDVLGGFLN